MFEDDWFMRQVNDFARTLGLLVFHSKSTEYVPAQEGVLTETDLLYGRLNALVRDGKLNEAEDLLFENMEPSNTRYLELAVDFYSRLNAMSDEQLEACDFSREEVNEGLHDAAALFKVNL